MSGGRKNVPTVSVVIPAYNEADTIREVVSQVFSQSQDGFSLEEVLVYSDGSTDATVSQAEMISDPRLVVIAEHARKGLAAALTHLFGRAKGDIAIILNADIALDGPFVLSKLVAPIREGISDVTAARIEELPADTFFESMLANSMKWKKEMFFAWKGGDNIFTCFGPARAFSKRLYTEIQFPFSACDDAYSYLFCKQRGYNFSAVWDAVVRYRLPSTFSDHVRQSVRHVVGMKHLRGVFGKDFVQKESSLPAASVLSCAWSFFIHTPVLFFLYVFCTIAIACIRLITPKPNLVTWSIASSSKISVSL